MLANWQIGKPLRGTGRLVDGSTGHCGQLGKPVQEWEGSTGYGANLTGLSEEWETGVVNILSLASPSEAHVRVGPWILPQEWCQNGCQCGFLSLQECCAHSYCERQGGSLAHPCMNGVAVAQPATLPATSLQQ
jgi:hypothetical protein